MKQKINNLLALLIVVSAGLFVENLFIEGNQINNSAHKILTDAITKPNRVKTVSRCNRAAIAEGKIALQNANIPSYPDAQRLTFDGGDAVRYRVPATAGEVAKFYSQNLSNDCWTASGRIADKKTKLTIALYEDPESKKTYATFAISPRENVKVLGIELAQYTDPSQPAGTTPGTAGETQPTNTTPPPPPTGDINQPLFPNSGTMNPPMPQQPLPGTNMPMQTCQVNGVEMPGPCPVYNNMPPTQQMEFTKPPEGQTMGPVREQGQGGQQGPSKEDMKKMDERRFKDMKRGLEQFSRGVKMMKKSASRMEGSINKCGVGLPEELKNALANSDNVINKIQAAQSADELEDAVGDVEDIGSVLQEWGPRMGDLQRLCQMLKQGDREMKQLERSLKRAEIRSQSNKKIDLSEIIANYKQDVENLRQALKSSKELSKTDPESAMEKIEDEFFGQMDNVRNNEMAIDMALNITRGLRDAKRELQNYQRQINSLKKKKIDTADVEEQLASLKTKLDEINNYLKGKFDAEELVSLVEETFDAREKLQDDLQELGGGPQTMPQIKANNTYNVRVNLPDSFKKQDEEDNNDDINSGEKLMPISR